jgi:hypothetical protein
MMEAVAAEINRLVVESKITPLEAELPQVKNEATILTMRLSDYPTTK